MNWLVISTVMAGTIALMGVACAKEPANTNHYDSVNMLRRSAEAGNSDSQVKLGYEYYRAIGVPRDYTKAMKWFRLAAAHANSDAEFYIGVT